MIFPILFFALGTFIIGVDADFKFDINGVKLYKEDKKERIYTEKELEEIREGIRREV